MVDNFPGQPPRGTVVTPYPQTDRSGQSQITGSGGSSLVINADGSLNAVPELPPATTLTEVVLSATANGNNIVVASLSSKTIKVYRMILSASVAVDVIMKSGSTALTGAIHLSTTQPLVLGFNIYPWFHTAVAADDFVLNLSTTASVTGSVSVIQS